LPFGGSEIRRALRFTSKVMARDYLALYWSLAHGADPYMKVAAGRIRRDAGQERAGIVEQMASFCDAQARAPVQDPSKLEMERPPPLRPPVDLGGTIWKGRASIHKPRSTVYGLIHARHLPLDLSRKQFSSPSEKLIWQIMILSAFCRTNLGIFSLSSSAAFIS
jgi:hypothetical protein